MVTCRPSYYRVHLHRTRSAPFCFPCFVFPCSCRRLPERNRSPPPAEQHKGLFSFVASIGRDGGQCVLKQGDSRTILWPRLRRAAAPAGHVSQSESRSSDCPRSNCCRKMDSIGHEKKVGLAHDKETEEGEIPCKIVCDRLYGPDRVACWRHRRRMIRYRGVCAKVCDG